MFTLRSLGVFVATLLLLSSCAHSLSPTPNPNLGINPAKYAESSHDKKGWWHDSWLAKQVEKKGVIGIVDEGLGRLVSLPFVILSAVFFPEDGVSPLPMPPSSPGQVPVIVVHTHPAPPVIIVDTPLNLPVYPLPPPPTRIGPIYSPRSR